MMKRLGFASLAVTLWFVSYQATRYTLAQIQERSIGEPVCTPYNDQSGTSCYELKCRFTGTDNPGNFDSCQSTQGAQNYIVTKCKYAIPCPQRSDRISCNLDPPNNNAAVYSYTDCDGVERLDQSFLVCPVKCKKCLTKPNVYGFCPTGYYKASNCCWPSNVAGYPGGCNGPADFENFPQSGCATGFVNFNGTCDRSYTFQAQCAGPTYYEPDSCTCPDGIDPSPIIIDIDSNGFNLTSAANGVEFDIFAEAVTAQRISWTSAGSSNALLVLDRNGNSIIDNGQELFGNITPQPPSAERQGFKALAVYDAFAQGGNSNGKIDSGDTIFSQLRLWQDLNHNGYSEATELKRLDDLGVATIDLDYKLSNQIDGNGNRFRYRAKITNAQGVQNGRWAWDVFLTLQY